MAYDYGVRLRRQLLHRDLGREVRKAAYGIFTYEKLTQGQKTCLPFDKRYVVMVRNLENTMVPQKTAPYKERRANKNTRSQYSFHLLWLQENEARNRRSCNGDLHLSDVDLQSCTLRLIVRLRDDVIIHARYEPSS